VRFLSDRRANRIPLEQLFWRDMLFVGTSFNLSCLAAAMILASQDLSPWIYVPVFLMALPYNIFIWHCVWSVAAWSVTVQRMFVRTVATIWLMAVIIL
jgi:hypothetical protein